MAIYKKTLAFFAIGLKRKTFLNIFNDKKCSKTGVYCVFKKNFCLEKKKKKYQKISEFLDRRLVSISLVRPIINQTP